MDIKSINGPWFLAQKSMNAEYQLFVSIVVQIKKTTIRNSKIGQIIGRMQVLGNFNFGNKIIDNNFSSPHRVDSF